MELRNPVFPVELIGGPLDGVKKLVALSETSDILEIRNEEGKRAVYEWREGTFGPYQFVFVDFMSQVD